MAEAALSKIIGIIMENPKLVAEIKDMVTKAEADEGEAMPEKAAEVKEAAEGSQALSSPVFENTYRESKSSRRNDLLRAMRPYVSEERGRAIESMITIMDILFTIKEK